MALQMDRIENQRIWVSSTKARPTLCFLSQFVIGLQKSNMESSSFASRKSIYEARDRLIMNNSLAKIVNKEVAKQSKTKKPKLEEEKQVAVWKPSFQREDFMEEIHQLETLHKTMAASVIQQNQS